jgi:heme exporter protein D
MKRNDRLMTAFWLAVLAFLGFYVFGLIMGVYSPGEVLYFTIPAAVLAILYVVHVVRSRRAINRGKYDEVIRESQRLRERRGF